MSGYMVCVIADRFIVSFTLNRACLGPVKVKLGKAIPLQAWTGPEGSSREYWLEVFL